MATIIQFPISRTQNDVEFSLDYTASEVPVIMPLYHGSFWRSVQELDCLKASAKSIATQNVTQNNIAHWVNTDFLPARNSLRNNPQLYQSMIKLLSLKLISNS